MLSIPFQLQELSWKLVPAWDVELMVQSVSKGWIFSLLALRYSFKEAHRLVMKLSVAASPPSRYCGSCITLDHLLMQILVGVLPRQNIEPDNLAIDRD